MSLKEEIKAEKDEEKMFKKEIINNEIKENINNEVNEEDLIGNYYLSLSDQYKINGILQSYFNDQMNGIDLKTGKNIIIKHIYHVLSNFNTARKYLTEIKIARTLGNHPNILNIQKIFINPDDAMTMFLIYDEKDFNLFSFIQFHSINIDKIKLIICQLIAVIKYLHNLDVIHRNLKVIIISYYLL
jgi:serine/threonine protein kinase